MKWENNGYSVELKGDQSDFYCSIINDDEEYTRFYPDYSDGKSDFEDYLNEFGHDLFGSLDINGDRLWIPMYCVRIINLNDKWAEFEDVCSTHSKKDAKEEFRALGVPIGFKLVLLRLEEPDDFYKTGESEDDNYTVIDEKW